MGNEINNLIIEGLLGLMTMAVTPGRGISVSSWFVIAFLIVLIALVVVAVNLLITFKINKTNLKKERDNNSSLSANYKNLEKKYNDTVNEKTKLNNANDELRESNEKLKKMAYNDNLTSLPNTASFKELLDSVMMTLREGETVGLLVLNIDSFKDINSQLGSSYGDELLIDVTHRLKQVINENDFLARVGGDEFAILNQNISDSTEYEDKIKRIINVFSYPFILSTEERFISVSIGIAIAPRDGDNSSALFKNARVAMRNAKARGKDGYLYFDETMNDAITKKIQIQSELRKAFEDNEFELYYEPVISLKDNKIMGLETLICWNHPTRGILHPDEFILYANETGLIVPIGVWALKLACKHLKTWQDKGYTDVKLFYKVSQTEFKNPEFISIIWDVVAKSEIDPKGLIIEITENTALDNPELTISTIDKLGELNVKFSLDQFGVNFGSIGYLDQFSLSYIKLDSKMSDIENLNSNLQKATESIINLIKIFNVNVIVDGIDNEAQEMFFKKLACDMAQGSLYSSMLSEEESIKLLEYGYILN